MQNLEVMVVLFIIVILGYVACKLVPEALRQIL